METPGLWERVRQEQARLLPILGRNIAFYRRQRGMKQLDLATRIGYSDHSMVSKFERGHRWPPDARLLALVLVLEVPLAFLLWEPDPPPWPPGWPPVSRT